MAATIASLPVVADEVVSVSSGAWFAVDTREEKTTTLTGEEIKGGETEIELQSSAEAWGDDGGGEKATIIWSSATGNGTVCADSVVSSVWWIPDAKGGMITLTYTSGSVVKTAVFEVVSTIPTETQTTEVPVPYSWLEKYYPGVSDYESAAKAKTGKRNAFGHEFSVWEEYVAGTDPTNTTSVFSAKIEMVDGVPRITWEPDMNEDGSKNERLYKIWGKEALDDGLDWVSPTNSLHRFFRVTVEMPEE